MAAVAAPNLAELFSQQFEQADPRTLAHIPGGATRSNLSRVVVSASTTSANAEEFERADLLPAARARALEIRNIALTTSLETRSLVRLAKPTLEEDVLALEEGGVSLSFSKKDGRREAVFVMPADGSVLYFIARGQAEGFRRAGIVLGDPAIVRLARWASNEAEPFSERDLEVG
jgi:hypothetical protein